MKLLSKNNVNFTFILQVSIHQTVSNFGWGFLDIIRSNTLITACNGLLIAQVFKTHAYHIQQSNISSPGLHLTEHKRIFTLLKNMKQAS